MKRQDKSLAVHSVAEHDLFCFYLFIYYDLPMRSSLLKISTVVSSRKIEESGRAMVQDVKVHHCAVTRYQTGGRQHLKR